MASRKIYMHNRGFTLLETMLVLALFAVVGSLALVMSHDAYHANTFYDERSRLVSVLQKARSQAMSGVCLHDPCAGGEPHGVHIGDGVYVVFEGTRYDPIDATNESIEHATANVLVLGGTDVVFSPLAATATPQTLTLSDAQHTSHIGIGSEGQITWDN